MRRLQDNPADQDAKRALDSAQKEVRGHTSISYTKIFNVRVTDPSSLMYLNETRYNLKGDGVFGCSLHQKC